MRKNNQYFINFWYYRRNFRSPLCSYQKGVIALTKALSNELAGYGITVNCVTPSKIDTEMFRNTIKSKGIAAEEVIEKIPVGRLGTPEDIADAVAYFVGEEAGYTTGQVLVVSGGY